MSASTATYYDLLQVSQAAEPDSIRAAYRRLAQRYHPDKQAGNPDAQRVMAGLNEAYAVLSDPPRRAAYDALIAAARARAREQRHRRFAEVQAGDAAWPWWLLFATISFCLAAVGISIYKGYVPGAAGAGLSAKPVATAKATAKLLPN